VAKKDVGSSRKFVEPLGSAVILAASGQDARAPMDLLRSIRKLKIYKVLLVPGRKPMRRRMGGAFGGTHRW
jgi:hypothetical protein